MPCCTSARSPWQRNRLQRGTGAAVYQSFDLAVYRAVVAEFDKKVARCQLLSCLVELGDSSAAAHESQGPAGDAVQSSSGSFTIAGAAYR